MVFGLGAGKIELEIPKLSYVGGETIEGKVKLKVNNPIRAKGVRVVLTATEEYNSRDRKTGRIEKNTRTIFNFEKELDTEREYSGESEYDFSLDLPDGATNYPSPDEGALGAAFNVLNMVSGVMRRIKWTIRAKLDIPMGLDVGKTVQISVSEPKKPQSSGF
ncbi:MAG: sporulation protein [archaeon]|nr:sporulation protein [archaeon]